LISNFLVGWRELDGGSEAAEGTVKHAHVITGQGKVMVESL